MKLFEILGHQNTYFFMRNLNFWSIFQYLKESMFEASEALQKMEGKKKIKSTSFHQYSWNSEVETTWISLIGWHHKTIQILRVSFLRFHGQNEWKDRLSVHCSVCTKKFHNIKVRCACLQKSIGNIFVPNPK